MEAWGYLVIAFWFCAVVTTDKPPACTTPNDEKAHCVSLFSCPILQKAVSSNDASVKKFVEVSACGNGQFMVCCGTAGNFTNQQKPELGNKNKEDETPTQESINNFVIKELLPDKRYCGMQHTDDYFYNQTVTSVDEFPWMVYLGLVEYGKNSILYTKCSGVLLNNRYLLTSLSCVRTSHIYEVKIGLYHIKQNVSCIITDSGEEDCTEVVNLGHYFKTSLADSNLLVVQLSNNLIFTDYVRPICLPFEDSERPQIGDTVVTSGWGEGQKVNGDIKKRVKHTIVSNNLCRESSYPILCARTIQNSTDRVCLGDDGGPLMYKRNNNWFAAGIVTGVDAEVWNKKEKCFNKKAFTAEPITSKILDSLFEFMYYTNKQI